LGALWALWALDSRETVVKFAIVPQGVWLATIRRENT
jgi:hypothetical protein